jgi:hypothetical protein
MPASAVLFRVLSWEDTRGSLSGRGTLAPVPREKCTADQKGGGASFHVALASTKPLFPGDSVPFICEKFDLQARQGLV